MALGRRAREGGSWLVRILPADVVFRGNTGNYILLILGRLTAGRARQSGRIKIEGVPEHADLFGKMFVGF